MNLDFWKGKRVFISGHTGFKGSWMSLWLSNLGADVYGYSLNPPTNPSLFEKAQISRDMKSFIGDIRDTDMFHQCLNQVEPEIVFHMAAQPLVKYSYKDPVETYSTNVMGTVNMLEGIRKTPSVRSVVVITSDKCYENREWDWGYRETDAMGGFDPYSSSKGCTELVTSAYRSSYFNPKRFSEHNVALATVRAGNVIGGGDWASNRLIPDILSAFNNKEAVVIRNPNAIRPWQHVLEPLRGYLVLAEKLYKNGPQYVGGWNFGPNDEDAKTVQWIVESMLEFWGEDAKWKFDDNDHPHEAGYLKLDISKSRNQLNWHPILSLKESLNLVVDWAKQYQKGVDVHDLTINQINVFQNRIKD